MISADEAALWIGYAVMVSTGLMLACVAVFAGMAAIWNLWRKGLNMMDLMAATKEWRERHPEAAGRFAERNGFGPEKE